MAEASVKPSAHIPAGVVKRSMNTNNRPANKLHSVLEKKQVKPLLSLRQCGLEEAPSVPLVSQRL